MAALVFPERVLEISTVTLLAGKDIDVERWLPQLSGFQIRDVGTAPLLFEIEI
ncbi:MAG: hypothetical protein WC552_07945 [Candidatus Omnitrophota bacterium]